FFTCLIYSLHYLSHHLIGLSYTLIIGGQSLTGFFGIGQIVGQLELLWIKIFIREPRYMGHPGRNNETKRLIRLCSEMFFDEFYGFLLSVCSVFDRLIFSKLLPYLFEWKTLLRSHMSFSGDYHPVPQFFQVVGQTTHTCSHGKMVHLYSIAKGI